METTNTETLKLLVQVARLYYEEGRTQEDIARELGISRPIISRLLKQARDEGIVLISIIDPFSYNLQLAEKICQATGLAKVIVSPGAGADPASSLRRLGLAAAHVLNEVLEPGTILGVGWGRTLYAVAQSLEPQPKPGVTAVPLVGGFGQVSASFQVHEITRQIANNYGCRQESFYVPALVSDPNVHASLMESQDVRHIHQVWQQMSVALVGIGNVDFDSEMVMLFADYLDSKTRAQLKERHAAGDICMRFFDQSGQPMPEVLGSVIGVELDQLKKTPNVIGVAGGKEKAPAILGAIRGGYIHTLVTDEAAANAILSLLQEAK